MLFRKKIERACVYCAHSVRLEDGTVLCSKKGLKSETDKCFRFRYDPCKRIMPDAPDRTLQTAHWSPLSDPSEKHGK